MRRWLTWERREPAADVLVVTNMWPDGQLPTYGVFVRRQTDDVRTLGVPADVLYLRGYRSPLAYVWAALWFAWSSIALRGRYRLVHVHAGETALAARFHLGTPMLVSYCGDDVLGDPNEHGVIRPRSRVRSAAVRLQSRLFTATITKTREMHDRLPRATRARNTVLPNGVDASVFRPLDRAEARREAGWTSDETVVLFAATKPETPRKRLGLAREACRRAEARVGPIQLHVAGTVDPARMPLLMSAADVLLLTSSVEGSPNVVKEALMCNLPVVATPVGDVRELLKGVAPSEVANSDPDALADALVRVLTEGGRSNGRDEALRLRSERIAARLVKLYDRVGRRERRRAEAAPERGLR
jgi:teichuronic acid biosynthesis glycosyltransferase TuaC